MSRVNKGLSRIMENTPTVHEPQRKQRVPKSFRYPVDRIKLLESIAARDGETFATTVAVACDRFIEEHYPGALKGAA